MENATKALLIAASILIVIILIAFAIATINSTTGTKNQVIRTMNASEIAMFNNKFTSYLGSSKTAAEVKSLCNVVIASNAVDNNKVSINGKEVANDISEYMSTLSSGIYTVTAQYSSDGLITSISISENI